MDEALDQLAFWCENATGGIVCVVCVQPETRRAIEAALTVRLTRRLTPVTLSRLSSPVRVVDALAGALAIAPEPSVLLVDGWEEAFSDLSRRKQGLYTINLNRERLADPTIPQVWLFSPAFLEAFQQGAFDTYTWFRLILEIEGGTEQVKATAALPLTFYSNASHLVPEKLLSGIDNKLASTISEAWQHYQQERYLSAQRQLDEARKANDSTLASFLTYLEALITERLAEYAGKPLPEPIAPLLRDAKITLDYERGARAWAERDFATAESAFRQSIQAFRTVRDSYGEARALKALALVQRKGDDFRPPLTLAEYKAQLVTVPAGPFIRGSDTSNWEDERPQASITLPEFRIGKTPVTVGMWQEFCIATKREMPEAPPFNESWVKREHPIVNVSWHDVKEYAAWAKLALPSEAQWEKAARGTDGREYPWGSTFDPERLRCWQNGGEECRTAPVGSFPSGASPHGALDMAGNVWEWCEDVYAPYNSDIPPKEDLKTLRGGSWYFDNGDFFRCASRDWIDPARWDDDWGFRLVFPEPFA